MIGILWQLNNPYDNGVRLSCFSERDYEVLKWIIVDMGTEWLERPGTFCSLIFHSASENFVIANCWKIIE